MAAVSNIDAGSVQLTFWLFAVLFTTLLIAGNKNYDQTNKTRT